MQDYFKHFIVENRSNLDDKKMGKTQSFASKKIKKDLAGILTKFNKED